MIKLLIKIIILALISCCSKNNDNLFNNIKYKENIEKKLSQKEYDEKVNEAKSKDLKEKVKFALISPFLIGSVVAISPVLFIESLTADY